MQIDLTPERAAVIINALQYTSAKLRMADARPAYEREILADLYKGIASELKRVFPDWEKICDKVHKV